MLERVAKKMRKGADEVIKVNHAKWNTLSTAEKGLKLVLGIIKAGLILSVGIVGVTIAAGVWIAVQVMSGLTSGINDQIQRDYNYRHRNDNITWR